MAFCSNCGEKINDRAKFCQACGTLANDASKQPMREQEYAGKIIKCPACGEKLPSLTALCPACGHEINFAKVSSSLSSFIDALKECDALIAQEPKTAKVKKGWSTWSKGKRILWVIINIFISCIPLVIYLVFPLIKPLLWHSSPGLSPEEEKKSSIIENYAFPNEREAILEALLFTKSKMAFLASEKYTVKTAFWMRLWNTKAKQLQQKASILLKGDSVADATYGEILHSKAQVEKRVRIRAAIGAGIAAVFIVFVVVTDSLLGGMTNIFPDIGSSQSSKSNFEWLETGLSIKIPKLDCNKGTVHTNSDTELWLSLDGVTYTQFEKYVTSCQEMGYTVDAEKDTHTYAAYNGDGYLLEVSCWSENLSIELKAPLVGDENFKWPDHNFATLIPELSGKSGAVETASEDTLRIMLYDVSASEVKTYIDNCEGSGFTIDLEKKDTTLSGFNADGYELFITYNEMKAMSITLNAPIEFSKITWPSSGPATLLPKPSFTVGRISSDYDWTFSAYLGEMTIESFNTYIDKCIKKGFEKDYRSEHYFSADKGEDVSLTVEYVGFNTVVIQIYDYDKFG